MNTTHVRKITRPVTGMGVTGKNHVPFRSSNGDGTAAAAATTMMATAIAAATPIKEHVRHVVATQPAPSTPPDEKIELRHLKRIEK